MYRIIFKPSSAAWVVQLATLGIFWSTVKDGKADRKFDNYEDALKYVFTVGLDQVYKDWSTRPGLFTSQGYQPVETRPGLFTSQGYQPVETRPPHLVRQRAVI